jgi:hypothetical protein
MPRLPRTDVKAADEGRWFDYPRIPGIRVKMRFMDSPVVQSEIARLSADHLQTIREQGRLPDDIAKTLTRQVMASHVIVETDGIVDDRVEPREVSEAIRDGREPPPDGWVVEDGKAWKLLEQTPEAFEWLLTEPEFRDFAVWLDRTSVSAARFRATEVARLGKSSPTGSSGDTGSPRRTSGSSKSAASPESPRRSSTNAPPTPPGRSPRPRGTSSSG